MIIISDIFVHSDLCFSMAVLLIHFVLNFDMNLRLWGHGGRGADVTGVIFTEKPK